MTQTFHHVQILNPFNTLERRIVPRAFKVGQTVADLFPGQRGVEFVISVNGRVVEDHERSAIYLQAGDYAITCPLVAGGGGGGKSILRIVALIAVSVMTAGAGSAIGGALMGTDAIGFAAAFGGFGVSLANAGVMMAGGMLVNALLPPPSARSQKQDSPTYGIDGAKNTSAEGMPTPVTYGKFRYGGNIINNYVVNDGDAQWLYMLINAGEGPIAGITDLEINEQPLSAFKDVEYQVRLGTPDQAPISWFADTIVPQSIGHKLTEDWHNYTTSGEVDRVRLDFAAPAGIYRMDDGDRKSHTVTVEIQYKLVGAPTWIPLPGNGEVASYTNTISWIDVPAIDAEGNPGAYTAYTPTGSEYLEDGVYYVDQDDGLGGTFKRAVGTVVSQAVYSATTFPIKAKQTSAVRRSFMSVPLTEGTYDVRVRRTNAIQGEVNPNYGDILFWSDINEIVNEDVSYGHTALLGLKIRLSDQLNGIPNVTHLNHGKLIRQWNDENDEWDFLASSNPAWVTFDILGNKRYGGGAPNSRFNLEAWKDWARFCKTSELNFDGVFDTQTNCWDAAQQSLRCGRAQMVRVGTRYTVAIERAQTESMMFTVGNILQGSFKETWMSMSDRANEIEGTFNDATNNYKPRTIKVYDSAAVAAGMPQRATTVELRGVTDAQRAWDDLNIMLNINRYIQRTVEFAAPMEAIGCSVGDVFLMQHDQPKWGDGGRVSAPSSSAHRYWRLYFTGSASGAFSYHLSLDEVEFLDAGDNDLTENVGAVTTPSTSQSAYTGQLTNNLVSDSWLNAYGTGLPQWIKLDLGVGNTAAVKSFSITSSTINPAHHPTAWRLECSDDGSTWHSTGDFTQSGWPAGERKVYTASTANTASIVEIDREVEMEYGKTYKLLCQFSALKRYEGTVNSVVHNSDSTLLLLNSFSGAITPTRIKILGQDLEVLGTFQSGAYHGVRVLPLSGVTAGVTPYELWNTDVIETRTVLNPAGVGVPVHVTQLTVTVPFTGVPELFTSFMFGETAKVAKPFRLKSISGSHEYHRNIVAVEYNASVYDPAGAMPTPNYSALDLGVDHVTITGVTESLVMHGLSYKSRVTVNYESSQQTYQHANVFLSRNGGPFEWVGRDIYSVTVDGGQSESLVFKVVAVDVLGKSAPESNAPTITYVVLGKIERPGDVAGLNYDFTDTGIQVSWTAPTEQDWLTTKARLGADFDTGYQVYDAKGTSFELPFQATGTQVLGVKHFIQGNLEALTPTYMNVVVAAPAVATILGLDIMTGVVMLRWTDAKTSQPIRHYIIKLGSITSTWDTAVEVNRSPRTANSASIVIPAAGTRRIWVRAEDMAGNLGATAYTDFTVSTSSAVALSTSSQVFRVAVDGTPSPSSIALVASLTGELVGGTVSFSTVPTVTLTGTGNSRALAYAAMGANDSVAITASITYGGDTFTDTVTIVKLQDGAIGEDGLPGIAFVLSNESHTLPSTNAGVVTDFSGASTVLNIYLGSVDDTANWTFLKADTNVHSTLVGNVVTVDAMDSPMVYDPPGPTDLDFHLGDPLPLGANPLDFAMGDAYIGDADIGWVDIVASRVGFPDQTRRFSLTKSRTGQDGTAFMITASTQILVVAKDGSVSPTSVTFAVQNETVTPTFSVIAGTATLTGTGTTRSMTAASMTSGFVTVQATSAPAVDTITVIKVNEGSDAVTALLSNESHALPATAAGVVTDFTGAESTALVMIGAVNDTANWAATKADTNVTSTLAGKTVTITAMPSGNDTGYVDITLTRAGYTTIVRRFTITKLKQGVTGAAGSFAARGNVQIAAATAGTAWSNTEAVAAIAAAGYGTPLIRDLVTLYNSAAGYSESRFWDGSAWIVITQYLSGGLFVDGTIAGTKIVADSITATQLIKTAALITDELQVGTAVIAQAAIQDLAVGTLQIDGEAVIAPRFASASSQSNSTGAESTILTLPSVTADRGDGTASSVLVFGSIRMTLYRTGVDDSDFVFYPATLRLKRDGTTIKTTVTALVDLAGSSMEASFNAVERSYPISFVDATPGLGAHVYTVTLESTGVATVGYIEAIVMAVKR